MKVCNALLIYILFIVLSISFVSAQNVDGNFLLDASEIPVTGSQPTLEFELSCSEQVNEIDISAFINDESLGKIILAGCSGVQETKISIPNPLLRKGENKLKFTTRSGKYVIQNIVINPNGIYDTLAENIIPNKLYKFDNKDYYITLDKVDSQSVEFAINEIKTGRLNDGGVFTLKDGKILRVSNILFQNFPGGIHSASFSFGDLKFLPSVEINTETINKPQQLPEKNEVNPLASNSENTLQAKSNKNITFIIGGFIVLIVLVLGLYFTVIFIKKRPKKIKEEKAEEGSEEVLERPAISKSADAILVSGFSLKHGKNIILDSISFEIKRGELVCLLGPSGTGKSTIIESLVGRKTPDKGTIKILGEDINKNKKIMDYVGFVPQGAEIYMNQTAEQNLLTSATKWGVKDAKKKAEKVLLDIGLTQRANIEAKKLSGGQQKLLSLGMELIREPELLILDEPTTGLDPNTRNNIITIISQIVAQRHKTALFTTHFMDDAEECDNVIILADKKIVAQGNPSKLKKMLPGTGRIVNVILDNVTDDLLNKIKKIDGIKEIIREGRSLKIITEEPNAVKLGQKIDEIGGIVNKTEIVNATMKEVFVYFTGKQPED